MLNMNEGIDKKLKAITADMEKFLSDLIFQNKIYIVLCDTYAYACACDMYVMCI